MRKNPFCAVVLAYLALWWIPGAARLRVGVLNAKVAPKYVTYRVKRGDTLFSIAEKFYKTGHTYWKIIADENNVTPETLQPGMVLKIPMDPAVVYGRKAEKGSVASSKHSRKKPKGPTVGDTIDAVGKRIGYILSGLGLRFQKGPGYAFKVVLLIFAACFLYVVADTLTVWLGSVLMRVPEASGTAALKVSVSSAGLQLLFFLSLLMLGAAVNQVLPDTANVQNLRALSWQSNGVWYSAVLSAFLAFFIIPLIMAKQVYGITAGKAGGVIALAVIIKSLIALFPIVVAFVATGPGVA